MAGKPRHERPLASRFRSLQSALAALRAREGFCLTNMSRIEAKDVQTLPIVVFVPDSAGTSALGMESGAP